MLLTKIQQLLKITLIFIGITAFMSFATAPFSDTAKEKGVLCAEYAIKNGTRWQIIRNNKNDWERCIRDSPSLGQKPFIKDDKFKVRFQRSTLSVKIKHITSRKKGCWTVKLTQDGDKLGFTEAALSQAVDCSK